MRAVILCANQHLLAPFQIVNFVMVLQSLCTYRKTDTDIPAATYVCSTCIFLLHGVSGICQVYVYNYICIYIYKHPTEHPST